MILAAILASIIFLVSLVLIFTEKINRTIVGIAGAALMVGLGKLLGFYSESQAVAAVDFNTLGLLLGMMILVALLEPTGFFQYLAVWAGRVSKGHPVRLLVLLGTVTTVVSMFLDNVTTVILIAPVTILICEILGISPAPFLLAEALLSDTGGGGDSGRGSPQCVDRLCSRSFIHRFSDLRVAHCPGYLADGIIPSALPVQARIGY